MCWFLETRLMRLAHPRFSYLTPMEWELVPRMMSKVCSLGLGTWPITVLWYEHDDPDYRGHLCKTTNSQLKVRCELYNFIGG